jgi:hypothetical protein
MSAICNMCYSIPSLVRGLWDEQFSARKSRAIEGPFSREGHNNSPQTYQ